MQNEDSVSSQMHPDDWRIAQKVKPTHIMQHT